MVTKFWDKIPAVSNGAAPENLCVFACISDCTLSTAGGGRLYLTVLLVRVYCGPDKPAYV